MRKETAIQRLRELPGIQSVRAPEPERFLLQTAMGTSTLRWLGRSTRPSRSLLTRLTQEPSLLSLPHITVGLGAQLREAGVNYLDESGNVFLQVDGVTVWIDGRPPKVAPAPSSELRAAGYRVLGAALEAPDLFQRPLREIAASCGVSTSPVLGVRAFLTREGCLVDTAAGPKLIERRKLIDRWLYGYRDLLRRKLVIGRYALPGSCAQLAQVLEQVCGEQWAWGGSQAAFRRFSLGTNEDVIIHLPILHSQDASRVPLRPDVAGAVEALALPHASAWGGRLQGAVGPMLQLAELSARPDDRSREVAASLREHLEEHWRRVDG